MAKGKMYNFYVESREERDSWVDALRLTVIQLNPKSEYAFGEELGTGNFAKVHLCWRISDMSTKYAFKMIKKRAITKSRSDIVSSYIAVCAFINLRSNLCNLFGRNSC